MINKFGYAGSVFANVTRPYYMSFDSAGTLHHSGARLPSLLIFALALP